MEAPRELDPTLPFTRADGLAAGITPAVLRGPRYRKLGRGVYVDAAVPLTPFSSLARLCWRTAHAHTPVMPQPRGSTVSRSPHSPTST